MPMQCGAGFHTEAVAQETMRLLPVAPLQGAEPIEDTLIGDARCAGLFDCRRAARERPAQPIRAALIAMCLAAPDC